MIKLPKISIITPPLNARKTLEARILSVVNQTYYYHREQFFRKAKNDGSAFELNNRLDKSIGFHTRRWFESYKNNRLEDEYRKVILKRENVVKLEKENVIQKIKFKDIFT